MVYTNSNNWDSLFIVTYSSDVQNSSYKIHHASSNKYCIGVNDCLVIAHEQMFNYLF